MRSLAKSGWSYTIGLEWLLLLTADLYIDSDQEAMHALVHIPVDIQQQSEESLERL